MHPIEHLRYLSRASSVSNRVLVHESVSALTAWSRDPAGMVNASRSLLGRQPGVGQIWWACSRMLSALDPYAEAAAIQDELEHDRTAEHLAAELPLDSTVLTVGWPPTVSRAVVQRGDVRTHVVDTVGEGAAFVRALAGHDFEADLIPDVGLAAAAAAATLVLVEVSVAGPEAGWVTAPARAVAAVARSAGVPVWIVAPLGTQLPDRLWQAAQRRLTYPDPWNEPTEFFPFDLVSGAVGPEGFGTVEELAATVSCPPAPELVG